MVRQVLFGAALAVAIVGAAGSATAVPIDGGPVDSSTFVSAGLGSGAGYSYLKTASFTGSGGGNLILRSSTYNDSFGYSDTKTPTTTMTPIFANGASAGSSATISPTVSPFLFYFHTNGSGGFGTGSDPAATVFTDGSKSPATASQVDLAIYKSGNTYAFFFDDGGPAGCTTGINFGNGNCLGQGSPLDDNDYNDLVVTYTPTAVPEPVSLVLLGTGLAGVGVLRRAKQRV